MLPRTRVRGGISYDRYGLDRQIYCADTYPFSAPNGSKIVVCGHESGVSILWKGDSSSGESHNGNQQEDFESDTDMNEEEDFEELEHDSTKHSPRGVQKLDLTLGTAVLHLSFPPLPQIPRPQEVPQAPSLLQHNLVVAIACADNTIRLLTVPLRAPSTLPAESKTSQQDIFGGPVGKGAWGERIVTISNAHQKVPRGIALAFVSRRITDGGHKDDDGSVDALIASHAADVTGSLLVHRIPVTSGKEFFGAPEIWRSSQLASPACSLDMFVSSASGTSPKILVGESNGAVRIFECQSGKQQSGIWTLSLFAPETKNEHYSKSILSAKWILEGHAIAVLTGEGEWGIWNISYGGPGRGISASRPNPFTISGRVGIVPRSVPRKSSNEAADKSQLAPMTPSTRKIRQESLFTGKADSAETKGGVSVKRTIGSYSTGDIEESLLFWYGDNVFYLPNLQAYWQNKIKGAGSTSGTPASSNSRDISLVSFSEDARINVSAFPSENLSVNHPDFLVLGERTLVIAVPQSDSRTYNEHPATNQSRGSDQSLLSGGLLDVNGLGRILDGMRSNRSTVTSGSLTQKRVLFE